MTDARTAALAAICEEYRARPAELLADHAALVVAAQRMVEAFDARGRMADGGVALHELELALRALVAPPPPPAPPCAVCHGEGRNVNGWPCPGCIAWAREGCRW